MRFISYLGLVESLNVVVIPMKPLSSYQPLHNNQIQKHPEMLIGYNECYNIDITKILNEYSRSNFAWSSEKSSLEEIAFELCVLFQKLLMG